MYIPFTCIRCKPIDEFPLTTSKITIVQLRLYQLKVCFSQVDFSVTEKTTLADLLTLQLHMYEDEVHNTVAKAVKELAIEKVHAR